MIKSDVHDGTIAPIPASQRLPIWRGQAASVTDFLTVCRKSRESKVAARTKFFPLSDFATTQEITLTYLCGDEQENIQIHNSGMLTINTGCIARSPMITLQGHSTIRSTISER